MKDFCISAFLFLFGICHYILHWVGLAGLFVFGVFLLYIYRDTLVVFWIGCLFYSFLQGGGRY